VRKPPGARQARSSGLSAAPRGAAILERGAFYRFCRLLHGYLSAFAFATLTFFALTGILLNHPDWIREKSREVDSRLVVPAAVLAATRGAPDPAAALAAALRGLTPLVGAYSSGDVQDGEANLRFEGTKGASTVLVDLRTGLADITVERAGFLSVVGDLHRGKNAGAAWRWVIDASAILIVALSLIGFVLFFSLRFRLRTSLILTGLGLGLMVAVFLWLTA
jgi:uncharacterized protein